MSIQHDALPSPIEGLQIRPLRQIADARGKVMHMLRSDWPQFERFGEMYFSVVNPGAVKAWTRHHEMISNLTIPSGKVRFVFHDDRATSATRGTTFERIVASDDPESYVLLTIAPGIWYGFQGLGETPSVVANCASILHRAGEADKVPVESGPVTFEWK